MTIHKSQGQTLPQVVVDLGTAEKTAVISFVGVSRVRSLQNFVLQRFVVSKTTSNWKTQAITGKTPRRRKVKKSSRSYRASIRAPLVNLRHFKDRHLKASNFSVNVTLTLGPK